MFLNHKITLLAIMAILICPAFGQTRKFNQIPPKSSPPALTDQILGVTGGNTDNLYSLNQLQSVIGGPPRFNVLAYGATGNGATDDSVAMQSAANAAITAGGCLYFPAGVYLFKTPQSWNNSGTGLPLCVSGDIAGTTSNISQNTGSLLVWNGTCGQAAITATHVVNNHLHDFSILDKNNICQSVPGSIGLLLTSNVPGSDTGPTLVENVRIKGFYDGLDIGQAAGNAADTNTFINLVTMENSNIGVHLQAANTLASNFYQYASAFDGYGMLSENGASVINIFGGSSRYWPIFIVRLDWCRGASCC